MTSNTYGIAISKEEHAAWNKLDKKTREYLIDKYNIGVMDDDRPNRIKLAYEEALRIVEHGIKIPSKVIAANRQDSISVTDSQNDNISSVESKTIKLSFCVALDSETGKNVVNLVDVVVPYLDITKDEDCIVISFVKEIRFKLPDFVLVKFKHELFEDNEKILLFKAAFEASNKSFLVLTIVDT